MWYLILPPIVVIASFAFLIWFLTNRSKLPSIQERMENIAKQGSFREWQTLRLKQFILRFLERSMRSLKVLSLRVHNSFHTIGQSVHERRFQSDLLAKSLANFKREKQELLQEKVEVMPVLAEEARKQPTLEFTPMERKKNIASIPVAPQKEFSSEARPMVSERVVIPEKPAKKLIHDAAEEERLIKRIAANPKNVSAYEALGDYYLEQGDVSDAKSCYRQVLKLSPVHRMVKVKIRKLERLMEEQKEKAE